MRGFWRDYDTKRSNDIAVAASSMASLTDTLSSYAFNAPLSSTQSLMNAINQQGTSRITADTQLRGQVLCDMVAVRVDWRNRWFFNSQSLHFSKAVEALPRHLKRYTSADWSITGHPNAKLWEITGGEFSRRFRHLPVLPCKKP